MKPYHLFTFYFLFLNLPWQHVHASGNQTDRIALLKFKEGIARDPHHIFDSWNHSLHFCNWFGIRCSSKHHRVTSLDLQGHNLLGSISPYIGNLSFLRFINLQNNTLHGPIPQQIDNLFRLQSFLVINNSLTGEIPVNLTRCSQLKVIGLQGNNLTGKIPAEIGSLLKLQQLLLSMNDLRGEIPASLGNISSLVSFQAAFNSLVGNIPDDISRLTSLETFAVGLNQLSGTIPPSIFNISSLTNLFVTGNHLDGNLPESIGSTLPNLKFIGVAENGFSGSIPISLSNASQLERIDLGWNNFSGKVPLNVGNLKSLWRFRLHRNNLGSNSSTDLDFLTSLVNCTKLKILDFGRNNFGGVLPNSVANLSSELTLFYFGRNQIQGNLPAGLENLSNLIGLVTNYNLMTGVIPHHIGSFQKLQVLDFSVNRFSGQIPSSLANLTRLSMLYLSRNRFEGSIPPSIGKLKNLNILVISYNNNLTGAIPVEIVSLFSLSQALDLSYNSLTGNLPSEIGKLSSVTELSIEGNNLSGEIPQTIGNCFSLEYLYLQDNSFQGAIPSSLTSLKNLHYLDLSRNNLSGTIPEALQSFQYLVYLNLSFNDLEGEVPTRGIFTNASAFSLVGNNKLCGGIPVLNLPKCREKGQKKSKSLAFKLAIMIPCVSFSVLMMLAFFVLYYKLNSKHKLSSASSLIINRIAPQVSYTDLFQATDQFSSANLIGSGNFGSVYKGILDCRERPIAIKVLKLEQKGALKIFIAECKVLQNIKHRNLVKMITYCSAKDYKGDEFRALVFEYMGNGSLETWLHPDVRSDSQSRNLNFLDRIKIAFDVASAMYYLHDLCQVPIIHRDLKPSNVVLDDDMVAHVCDFGLAKLVSTSTDMTQNQLSTTGINGTIGYAAPEYGMGCAASKEGDIYSYGVLVLELFTGKRPTNEMFEDGLNLHEFVRDAVPDRVMEIVDERLLSRDDLDLVEGATMEFNSILEKYSLSILRIGLACSGQSPRERLSMKDVMRELDLIRNAFLDETTTTRRTRTRTR